MPCEAMIAREERGLVEPIGPAIDLRWQLCGYVPMVVSH